MIRERSLIWLSETNSKWGQMRFAHDFEFQDGQYVHATHDPITIDDWNRAKIVPNTKIRILSPEHSEYIQKLAFEVGFKWRDTGCSISALSTGSVILFLNNNVMIFNSLREHKEIFIELPVTKDAKEILSEADRMLKASGADVNARMLAEKVGFKELCPVCSGSDWKDREAEAYDNDLEEKVELLARDLFVAHTDLSIEDAWKQAEMFYHQKGARHARG